MAMLKILYQGEQIIIHPDQLDGYAGCEVLGSATEADVADDPALLVPPEHIASVHLQKAVEASLILSGVTLTHGLLAAEAEALGIKIEDLAEQVAAKREQERELEVARRLAKAKIEERKHGRDQTRHHCRTD
jgi:hypothetical protein